MEAFRIEETLAWNDMLRFRGDYCQIHSILTDSVQTAVKLKWHPNKALPLCLPRPESAESHLGVASARETAVRDKKCRSGSIAGEINMKRIRVLQGI